MVTATPADLVALLPGWDAELAYWRQLGCEAWADGYRLGYDAGFERGARLIEAGWPAIVEPVLRNRPDHAVAEARRCHVCCARCRRDGHRPGCPDCEDRDRETFGRPHPGDYGGEHG